jgi:hypothetical protein
MTNEEKKYDYDRFGVKAKRVGQAVSDILSKGDVYVPTAEEIAEERQQQYLRDLKEAADLGSKEFQSPFYVVYLFNKEHWSPLVSRGRFVRRQTEPIPENMMSLFPYFTKDVYKVDIDKGEISYLWTLPSLENFNQILKHKDQYDPAMSEWMAHPCDEKKPYSEIT